MRLIKSTPKGKQRVYDIEVADVHNFYANGVNVHNCATDGGISVIKDDGTVVDITADAGAAYSPVSGIDITEDYHLIFEQDSEGRSFFCIPIPSADRITATNDTSIIDKVIMKFYANGAHVPYPCFLGSGIEYGISLGEVDNQALVSTTGDLTILHPDFNAPANGMVAYAATSYNTGWMHGDIKGAFLSDTDATNVTAGSNLITSGDFSSSTGWTLGTGWTISGGKLNKTTTNNNSAIYTATGLTVGKAYTFSIDVDTLGLGTIYFYTLGQFSVSLPTTGTHSVTVVANSSTLNFGITGISGNGSVLDNASLTVGEADRSVNNKGLQVFGTITKTAVA